jgi:FtsH-binding integral membrane protein
MLWSPLLVRLSALCLFLEMQPPEKMNLVLFFLYMISEPLKLNQETLMYSTPPDVDALVVAPGKVIDLVASIFTIKKNLFSVISHCAFLSCI